MAKVIPLNRDMAESAAAAPYLARLERLRANWQGLEDKALIAAAVEEFGEHLAITSSFGSESVVELHLLSQVDASIPVIFLNTGKLFGETLRYRDQLQEQLGLTDVRSVSPDPDDRERLDSDGTLWKSNPDQCCYFRKTLPQERALEDFEAVITGRKRFQTLARMNMPLIDLTRRPEGFHGFRFVLNPLATWSFDQINAYIERHQLPVHPLVQDGYLSIGCMPCTERSSVDNYRAGRWSGIEKEECGIHQDSFTGGEGI